MIDRDTAYYVVRWYESFMTDAERRAQRHLFATMKASHGRSDESMQAEARTPGPLARLMSSDPEVLNLVREGYEAFVHRTAARILEDRGEQVSFNRCPQCGGLARTPKARQCRFCGHNWHELAS